MFVESSRYYRVRQREVPTRRGKTVTVVALRRTPVPPSSSSVTIKANTELDRMAYQRYDDGTRYWHIADANTELEARDLTAETGRQIMVPER